MNIFATNLLHRNQSLKTLWSMSTIKLGRLHESPILQTTNYGRSGSKYLQNYFVIK